MNNYKYSNMTKLEARQLKNKYGKNYNNGEYDDPDAQDDMGSVIRFFAGIGLIVFLLICG